MKRLGFIAVLAIILAPFVAKAFSASPAVIELSGNRGTSVPSQIQVQNTHAADQTFYLQTVKFAARDDSGSPVFLPLTDRTGLPEWIALSKTQVTAKAGETVTVPFTVAVPSDVASGSYDAAIVISDHPYDVVANQGASLQARTAILVFFTVNGETNAKAALLDFGGVNKGVTNDVSGQFRYRVQNQGNVYIAPKGSVTVTDLFGRELASTAANPDGGRVLPGTTRAYNGTFHGSAFAIGPVTAVLKVTYADDAPALVGSYTFWVFPVRQVAIAGIVALGIVFAGLMVRRIKRNA